MTREVTVRVSCDDLAEAMRLVASVSGRATARDGEAIATCTPDEASRVERICAKRGYACTISKGRGALSAADPRKQAILFRDRVLPAMAKLRATADKLETICPKDVWPFPTYADILFYE